MAHRKSSFDVTIYHSSTIPVEELIGKIEKAVQRVLNLDYTPADISGIRVRRTAGVSPNNPRIDT